MADHFEFRKSSPAIDSDIQKALKEGDPITEQWMANKDCGTPGAIYRTAIKPDKVSLEVELPQDNLLGMSEEEAVALEQEIHNAMEVILAKFF